MSSSNTTARKTTKPEDPILIRIEGATVPQLRKIKQLTHIPLRGLANIAVGYFAAALIRGDYRIVNGKLEKSESPSKN